METSSGPYDRCLSPFGYAGEFGPTKLNLANPDGWGKPKKPSQEAPVSPARDFQSPGFNGPPPWLTLTYDLRTRIPETLPIRSRKR